ncbi:hypothetical protein TRFO_41098 [Tritrichomonas foetus]|uniref:Uncharacterized protein n=1 Tax=Tritrichomonas foetus TaxID=1144522 RepID=A0A1J4L1P0_9EUKA|nr:hypothetical protein TRFO_41098 [Tritrichomonas foetus]|eukprot:OHT17355.1 hypothetical protein TRFO_41098 [Tritrichomonas foetus]
MCYEKNDYFQNEINSQISKQIQDIRSKVDIFRQSEIKSKADKISELIKSSKRNMDSINLQSASEIRSKLFDLVRDITSFTNNFSNFAESSNASMRQTKIEHQRITNQMSQFLSKVNLIENRKERIITRSEEHNNEFNRIDEKTLSSFSTLMNVLNETIEQTSNNLANEVKNEANSREIVNSALIQQVNTVNQNVAQSINRLTNDLKQVNDHFNKLLSNTNQQISEALHETQSLTDSMITQLNESIDPLVEEITKDFESMQAELVDTISVIRNNSKESNKTFEEVLEKEAKVRKNNHKTFLKKFNAFDKVVKEEQKMQNQKLKEIEKDIINTGIDCFNEAINKHAGNISKITNFTEILDTIESKLNDLDASITQIKSDCFEEIRTADLKLIDLRSSLETNKVELLKSYDFYEQRVNQIQNSGNSSSGELLQQIKRRSREFNDKAQERMDSVIRKAQQILDHINTRSLSDDFITDTETLKTEKESEEGSPKDTDKEECNITITDDFETETPKNETETDKTEKENSSQEEDKENSIKCEIMNKEKEENQTKENSEISFEDSFSIEKEEETKTEEISVEDDLSTDIQEENQDNNAENSINSKSETVETVESEEESQSDEESNDIIDDGLDEEFESTPEEESEQQSEVPVEEEEEVLEEEEKVKEDEITNDKQSGNKEEEEDTDIDFTKFELSSDSEPGHIASISTAILENPAGFKDQFTLNPDDFAINFVDPRKTNRESRKP